MFNLYRVDILEKRLHTLTQAVSGIHGAVIVSVEGFVVAAATADKANDTDMIVAGLAANTNQVAAMSATLMALGDQTLKRLAQGRVERLLIEGEDGAMIVYPINRGAALAAMVGKEAKMGLALLAVSRAARDIGDLLTSRPS